MDERAGIEEHCRICGYGDGSVLWEGGWPNYIICECCGNESGIGDDTVTQVRQLRGYWVGHGAQWDRPKYRPENWDVLAQLADVPPEWR